MTNKNHLHIITILNFYYIAALAQHADTSGPVFIQEPPNQVDFSNTTGMEVICQSRGTPLPSITWVRQDGRNWVIAEDVPGLRQVGDFILIIYLNYHIRQTYFNLILTYYKNCLHTKYL